MTRALLLLPLAALATGCYVAPPCDPAVNIYWGFTVPGVASALTCTEAGVDTVRIWVDGVDLGSDVSCTTQGVDGIQLVGVENGTHRIQMEVYSGSTLRYQADQTISSSSCASSFDVIASGIEGRIQFQYGFADGANQCAGPSYLWFQVTSAGAVYDHVDDQTSNPLALACTNTPASRVIDVLNRAGGTTIPAGIYSRTRFEEVVQNGASWTPQRKNCDTLQFVHAGDDVVPVTLAASSTLCP